jgi:hypothetical protein
MSFDSSTDSANRLIEMAGSQRLPAEIRRNDIRDETTILRIVESAVYAYTKTIPIKDFHDKKRSIEIYEEVCRILHGFDFTTKPVFLQAWKLALCGNPLESKEVLETLGSIACNRDIQRYITNQLRTPTKYKEMLKRVLNIGGTFESLFAEVGLTTTELAQRDNRIASDTKNSTILSSYIASETFSGDSDVIVQTFYKIVKSLHNDTYRNDYYNRFLVKLVKIMSSSAPTISLLNIFVQVYAFFMTSEIIKTVHPDIIKYTTDHPIHYFSHQVQHMPLKLQPNSNFKKEGFILDAWQEECLQAIDKKSSILMSARTSAGKTVLSTHAIRNNKRVWYIVPSEALGYQLAGIILASLLELELKKGNTKKNVRLELASTSFKRYSQNDNIIVATPQQMIRLIKAKQVELPEYIILDEFHNIYSSMGTYYEYLLKYSGYYKVPLMALSATIPNFEEVKEWLLRILPGQLFAVNQQKRFFNQKRMTFQVTPTGIELIPINPLDHMTIEQIRLPTFQQIGLYPQEVFSLYKSLSGVPRIDEATPRLISLDEMERLEIDLFAYLKKQEDATLHTIIKDRPLESDALSIYQLYQFLKKVMIKPMIIFKMNSLQCLTLFSKMVKMIQDYNKIVYGNFNGDKHIIKEYLEVVKDLDESNKLTVSEEEDIGEKKSAMLEVLFTSTYKPRLYAFYDNFLEQTPTDYTEFNDKYGADLTYKKVYALRKKHVHAEKQYNFESICVRSTYTIHQEAMIARTDGSNMKDIRDKINEELLYQMDHTPLWDDITKYGAEYDAFNKIEEIRTKIKYDPKENTWIKYGTITRNIVKDSIVRQDNEYRYNEVYNLRHVDIVQKLTKQNFICYEHAYNIDYEHPVLVGIECGLLFYNQLMNPALTRICQQLISKYPLIVLSDHSLAVGINYPIKTVLLLGGLKGEPIEEIENTIAHQASGRAGRRGLDAEGIVIYSGVNITKILTPQYYPVRRNPPTTMLPLLRGESKAFQSFVLTESYSTPAPTPAATSVVAAPVAPAPVAPAAAAAATPAAAAPAPAAATPAAAATGTSWEDYEC